jgi:hypothetical protein
MLRKTCILHLQVRSISQARNQREAGKKNCLEEIYSSKTPIELQWTALLYIKRYNSSGVKMFATQDKIIANIKTDRTIRMFYHGRYHFEI